jgi:hypothetical protein
MHRMECRAEDEARTRDINLGKVALYQLSYFRIDEPAGNAAFLLRGLQK